MSRNRKRDSKPHHPDKPARVEVGRVAGSDPTTTSVTWAPADEVAEREARRESTRELDGMIQGSEGYRQATRDAARSYPRDASHEPHHAALKRRLPEPDEIRGPISKRQATSRRQIARDCQTRMSGTQLREFTRIASSVQAWNALNDELATHLSDRTEVGEMTRRRCGRLDRGIQSYEEASGRENVVCFNAALGSARDPQQLLRLASQMFKPGDKIALDRYTMATHQMHELERGEDQAATQIVFELVTRRGTYLGTSTRSNTAQLLPRAMQVQIASAPHMARYRRPDGTLGTRVVVQIIDDSVPTKETWTW